MIALPDLRQNAQHDCGYTAVLIVLKHLRRRVTPGDLAPLSCNVINGTDPRAIESMLRGVGLRVISGEMSLQDLHHHTTIGRPVICLVSASGVGHYVVVAGVEFDRIHYQDPAEGPMDQPKPSWKRSWHDIDRMGATYRSWGIAVWR